MEMKSLEKSSSDESDRNLFEEPKVGKNLLVHPDNDTVKICDFGLARSFVCPISSTLTAEVATLRYQAPEVLMGSTEYTTAMDMWAVGCTFAEMLCLKQLFHGY
ncbi:hypothetical protein RHGRI_013823 [Rhododendron griersonianum]|uniref:Protein kinase domain-containing protein n=1 Tax=Rhododendron griersonianum TaxID=479676 RepID=A0AAV6K721_9ERIC|nr:hypothetical protein RHGRI_013823 [Rhododendron griersonianum]